MIWLSIFACVLALAAVACAVVALIISLRLTRAQASAISLLEKRLQTASARLAQQSSAVTEQLRELERRSPTKLAAEVAELSDAVARLAATHQRFAGRFHATKSREREPDEVAAADPEIAAMLSLQAAPPVKG